MDDKQLWRMFYMMVASWAYHPKGHMQWTGAEIAEHADRELRLYKQLEKERWPDGQPSDKSLAS